MLLVYLRDKGFSADIKISLLTKQRSIAIGRNLIVAGVLRPLISSLAPQSMPDAFKAHVNQLINDIRAGFVGVTDMLDDKAKPVREVTAFIPIRQMTIHPHKQRWYYQKILIVKIKLNQWVILPCRMH
ncbi:hypothetical protein [Shewanella morhuae]|uniref:hypothetical protein n=1 Tax=Shewanella morhuae TaxID=365591 RepID=UPI001C7CB9B4|nr:hypothetical protein [Shewanella morhuae]